MHVHDQTLAPGSFFFFFLPLSASPVCLVGQEARAGLCW